MNLSPEEQIKRNPALAFDDPEPPPSHEEGITELLRWFHRPEDAGGMTVYVPKDHPSGFGGSTVYIPKRLARREDVSTELLRLLTRPENAVGMSIDIPEGHPSGFGGRTVYIPTCLSADWQALLARHLLRALSGTGSHVSLRRASSRAGG